MTTYANEQAFADSNGRAGLTKREYMACQIMASLLAGNPVLQNPFNGKDLIDKELENCAELAERATGCLINILNKN